MSSAEQACEVCQNVSLLSLFQTELPLAEAVALGPLEEIINKSTTCLLCLAVVQSLSAPQPYTGLNAQKVLRLMMADGQGSDVWIYSYTALAEREMEEPTNVIRVSISTRAPDDMSPIRQHRLPHAGDIQLISSSATTTGVKASSIGREISPKGIDFSLTRSWLNECLQDHGELCSQQGAEELRTPLRSASQDLTVIDVEDRCLCRPPQDASYVALSYRWPQAPGLKNTKLTSDWLHGAGSIVREHGLSQTIEDACCYANRMGQRFLWVDVLCIKQDDPNTMRLLTSQMDIIYGGALFTIVAAPDADDEADQGLPGCGYVSDLRKQTLCTAQQLRLAIPKPCLEDVLEASHWQTRGWTFQESYLSRRLMIFTSYQTYFQCSCGIRCEDTAGEGYSPQAFVMHSTSLWNPRNIHARDGDNDWGDLFLSRAGYNDEFDALRAYDNFVSYYLRRELSVKEDRLRAFQGLLRIFERSMETTFICGLPARWFDHALLWQPNFIEPAKRLIAGSPEFWFPSWSWASWQGGSEAPYWLTPHATQSLLTWYFIQADGSIETIEPSLPADDINDPDQIPTLTNVEVVQLSAMSLQQPRIATATSAASFRLSGEPAEIKEPDIWPEGSHRWILDEKDQKVGLILVDATWASSNTGDSSVHQFLLLSRAARARMEVVASFDEDVFDTRPWCLLNLMLVNWIAQGVAERLAVGTIHADAWSAARRSNVNVTLV